MLTLLVCALISIACAIYGVSAFNNNYTCTLTKPFGKSVNTSCKYWMTIPSAVLVGCVLCVVTYRGALSPMAMTV